MFRHDIREKPVLYKEILKAISKRELLEDLCFCACRKDHFAGGSSPSLKVICPIHHLVETITYILARFIGLFSAIPGAKSGCKNKYIDKIKFP